MGQAPPYEAIQYDSARAMSPAVGAGYYESKYSQEQPVSCRYSSICKKKSVEKSIFSFIDSYWMHSLFSCAVLFLAFALRPKLSESPINNKRLSRNYGKTTH